MFVNTLKISALVDDKWILISTAFNLWQYQMDCNWWKTPLYIHGRMKVKRANTILALLKI